MRWSLCIHRVLLCVGAALLAGCVDQGPANLPPTAAFTAACDGLVCQLTDNSTDADGTIQGRAWEFGDGATSSERNPVHTYSAPGGQFTISLTVTDDDGEATSTSKPVTAEAEEPDRSGTYERETPHNVGGRHSRYVIRADGSFELSDWTGADTTRYTGRWQFGRFWLGQPIEPKDAAILLDFDGYQDTSLCGPEGLASFPVEGHMGIAYCGVMIQAGLEEGAYSRVPAPGTSGPPPQTGQIAFVRDGRIHLANSDGGSVVPLSAGPNDWGPAWSADGNRIAFTRASGATSGVFVMDADGGNVVQRASSGSDPTWSPDGQWITFACYGVGGAGAEFDICKVKAVDDGSGPINLTQLDGYMAYPAWSPDGTRIAYTSDWALYDILFDIWVVAPDGSNRMAVTTHTPAFLNPYESYQAAWSPDGQRIAFTRCSWAWVYCSASAVSVMSATGGSIVGLVMARGFARPTWSPDGQVIAYESYGAIEWVSANGSQRGRIIDNGHSPAWRP